MRRESVLAPKVLGTLLLDRHFRDEPLQLMVLCSSLNAVFGEPGTSDYSAANAYLDAFAAAHSRPDRPIVAIGWDAWREVGMAAKAAMSIGRPAVKAAMTDYFRASPETMFSLDEHRIMGIPTLPGTAYLQLALRAVERREAVGTMALSRITFTAPLSVADGHEARIRTSLTEEKRDTPSPSRVASNAVPGRSTPPARSPASIMRAGAATTSALSSRAAPSVR